jgi:hypothetical protein
MYVVKGKHENLLCYDNHSVPYLLLLPLIRIHNRRQSYVISLLPRLLSLTLLFVFCPPRLDQHTYSWRNDSSFYKSYKSLKNTPRKSNKVTEIQRMQWENQTKDDVITHDMCRNNQNLNQRKRQTVETVEVRFRMQVSVQIICDFTSLLVSANSQFKANCRSLVWQLSSVSSVDCLACLKLYTSYSVFVFGANRTDY